MGKIAFLFPGQGAQHPGMCSGLDAFDAARSVLDAVSSIRPDALELCLNGSADELSKTINTQPCMFMAELAAARALESLGIRADGCAGFSLGEITALAFSGALGDADAARLVCIRAEHMQAAAEANPGAMVAVLKLSNDKVAELCEQAGAWPVNYNCPGQVTCAGRADAIEALKPLVAEAGGRAVPLAVLGGFHSQLMHTAAEKLRTALDDFDLVEPSMPLYANRTAAPYSGDLKELVATQVENPVHWQQTIERMTADGFDTFVEVGPGKVLSGLVSRIAPDARILRCETAEEIRAVADELNQEA